MRRLLPMWALPVLVAVLFVSPLFAEEVIYFTNGTTMSIRSHKVEGKMITVELASNASLSFPLRVVDRLEVGGRAVSLDPSDLANQAVKGERGVTAPRRISGGATTPARFRGRTKRGARTPRSGNLTFPRNAGYAGGRGGSRGADVTHPFSGATNLGRRNVSMVGNRALYPRRSGLTETPGGEILVPDTRARAARQPVRFSPRKSSSPSPPPKPADQKPNSPPQTGGDASGSQQSSGTSDHSGK